MDTGISSIPAMKNTPGNMALRCREQNEESTPWLSKSSLCTSFSLPKMEFGIKYFWVHIPRLFLSWAKSPESRAESGWDWDLGREWSQMRPGKGKGHNRAREETRYS